MNNEDKNQKIEIIANGIRIGLSVVFEVIFKGLRRGSIYVLVIVFLLHLSLTYIQSQLTEKDSTDPADGRSGLGLYIDNLTGCHYIGTRYGGLTVRLDINGDHICSVRLSK